MEPLAHIYKFSIHPSIYAYINLSIHLFVDAVYLFWLESVNVIKKKNAALDDCLTKVLVLVMKQREEKN